MKQDSISFNLAPLNNEHLAELCGEREINLELIQERLDLTISHRAGVFYLQGSREAVDHGESVIKALYAQAANKSGSVTAEAVHLALVEQKEGNALFHSPVIKIKKTQIRAKNPTQAAYLRTIESHDISFGIGPAGTGKTYLAVACAAQALANGEIERIVLVRPAVEAGEHLGFLPGDIGQKVDPYLRPLYDALYEMLGVERVCKLIERGVIELAPLAYMRGRTLNESFILLDEAQNTTVEQMKMFLTRMGYGSKIIITGDTSQVDLPKHVKSGLVHVQSILENIEGIGFNYFKSGDVVRHALVQRIVEAYESEAKHSTH